MPNETEIDSIVLDTGPILQNSPSGATLRLKSRSIITCPSVIAEIKDVNARNHYSTNLEPFITIRTPSALSIKFVTDFARKTGDLAVLSKADVEILALAHELEHSRNDEKNASIEPSGQNAANDSAPSAASNQAQTEKASNPKPDFAKVFVSTPAAPWATSTISPLKSKPAGSDNNEKREGPTESMNITAEASEELADELESRFEALSLDASSPEANFDIQNHLESCSETIMPSPETEDYESDDSEGWITPANIKRIQAAEQEAVTAVTSTETQMNVAILTTDFAMQNVALQMKLNLLSSNLNRIRNIRNYILRCHACFQLVKDTSKQFCPRCGKPTLTRVSCSTNAKGEFRIHLKKSMQWNHRGDRYSIPKPVPGQANGKVGKGKGGGKGGWGQGLILAEDQKEYQRALSAVERRKGANFMDEDYLPSILTGNSKARPGARPKIGAGRNVNSKKRV